MLGAEDKISIVQEYTRSQSYLAVQRSFRRHEKWYHGKNLPCISCIQYVVNTFKMFETVCDRRKQFIPDKSQYLSATLIKEVKTVFKRKQCLPVRLAAGKSNCSGNVSSEF